MKLGNEFKRVLTGVMTAAMIFTSVPAAPVMAAAPADVLVESDDLQDISLEDGSEVLAESAEETLSEAPAAEDEAEVADDTDAVTSEVVVENNDAPAPEGEGDTSGPSTSQKIAALPLVDKGPTVSEGYTFRTTLYDEGTYKLTVGDETGGIVPVKVGATNLVKHYNDNHQLYYWIGFGMPRHEGWKITGYYIGNTKPTDETTYESYTQGETADWTDETDGKGYDSFYVVADTKAGTQNKQYIAAEYTKNDSEKVKVVYELDFSEVTLKNNLPDENAILANVGAAMLEDRATENKIDPVVKDFDAEITASEDSIWTRANTPSSSKSDAEVDVCLIGTGLRKHQNAESNNAYWSGVKIAKPGDDAGYKIQFAKKDGSELWTSDPRNETTLSYEDMSIAEDANAYTFYFGKLGSKKPFGKYYIQAQYSNNDGDKRTVTYVIDPSAITFDNDLPSIEGMKNIDAAPLVDHSTPASETLVKDGTYSASVTGVSENDCTISVNVAADDLVIHKNGVNNDGFWAGIAIPNYKSAYNTVSFKQSYTKLNTSGISDWTEGLDSVLTGDDEKVTHNTVYFNIEDERLVDKKGYVYVKYEQSRKYTDESPETESVIYTYVVDFSNVKIKTDKITVKMTESGNAIKSFDYGINSTPAKNGTIVGSASSNEVNYVGGSKITLSNFQWHEGKDISNTTVLINGKSYDTSSGLVFDLADLNGELEVVVEPKNLVTVSFNKAVSDFSTSGMKYYIEDEGGVALAFGSDEYATFYVQNGKSVSVDKPGQLDDKKYNFAKIDGVEETEDGKWDLGVINEDKTFTIEKDQYALSTNVVVNGNYPVTVSYDSSRMGGGAEEIVDDYWLFSDNTAEFLKIAVDTTYNKEKDEQNYYELKTVKYTVDGKTKTLSAEDSGITGSGGKYTINIPKADAKEVFFSGNALTLTADINKETYGYKFEIDVDPNAAAKAQAYVQGTKVVDYTTGSTSNEIKYGSSVKIFATPNPGFVLKGVSINQAASTALGLSENRITSVPEDELAKFQSASGYDFKMYTDVTFTFWMEKEYVVSVHHSDYTVPSQDKKGVYQVIYNKPVYIDYKLGEDDVDGYDYEVAIGGKTVSNNDAKIKDYIKKYTSGSGVTLDGKGADIQGKNVTITLFKKVSDNKVESSIKKLEFKVDSAAGKSIKFAKTEETVARGGKASLALKVKGNFDCKVTVSGDSSLTADFAKSGDYSSIDVTTTASTKTGDYTINVVDNNDSAVLASIKVTVKDVVDKALAPNAAITYTTNNAFYLNLTPNKLNTSLDGLQYKIQISGTGLKENSPLKATFDDITLPINTTMPYKLSLLRDRKTGESDDDWKAAQLDGDENAKFTIKVSIIQGTSSTAVNEKLKDQTTKPGGIFATKIKLKRTKDSVSKFYTNMDKDNAYKVEVDFGKDTSIDMLADYDLTGPDGKSYYGYVEYNEGTHVFTITAKSDTNKELDPGTYVLSAKALETGGIDVSATMKIKVVQAVESLALDSTKTIYKFAGKKATATVAAYDTTDGVKKAKKVIWTMVNADDKTKEVAFDGVTLKNGKITIAKDVVPKDIKFRVKAQANDYKGNKVVAFSDVITVADKPNGEYELAFSKDGAESFATINTSVFISDMFEDGLKNYGYEYVTYVMLREKEGSKDCIPASFKVSGAKLISTITDTVNGTKATYAVIGFTKAGKVKITANCTDGSERNLSGKQAVKIDVKPSTGTLGWSIAKLNATNIDKKGIATEGAASISCNVANGDALELALIGCDGKGNQSFINHKISVKGGKLVKTKNVVDKYVIRPTANKVEIKLTNTASKKTFTVTLDNKAISAGKVKTVIKASSYADKKNGKKIYSHVDFKGVDTSKFKDYVSDNRVNLVEYTVTPQAATKVLVTIDKDDATHGNPIEAAVKKAANNKVVYGAYEIPVVSGNFAIDFITDDKQFDIKNGTYKLGVTAVDNNYAALGKTVTVNVQAVAAPKAQVKVKNAVDFGTGTVSQAKIEVTQKGKNVLTQIILEGDLKNALFSNKTGSNMNNFSKNFAFTGTDNGYLKFVGKKDLDPKSKDKAEKAEFTGYIPYTYQNLDGTVTQTQVKVTIKSKGVLKGTATTP